MSKGFKISIITIVKNDRNEFLKTIESLKVQKTFEIEYVVIDGKSTDGTLQLIKENKETIDVYISENDSGIYDAMNKGIDISNGEFILFLNAGDKLCSQSIQRLIKSTFIPAEVICHPVNLTTMGFEVGKYLPERLPTNPDYQHMYWPHPGILAKKSVFNSVGKFNTLFQAAADLDWVNRVIKAGITYQIVQCLPIINFDLSGISSSMLSLKEARKISILHGKPKLSANIRFLKTSFYKIIPWSLKRAQIKNHCF